MRVDRESGSLSDPIVDVHSLVASGMSATLHWFPGDVSAARLAIVFAAMANASGGTVLLGISPRSGQIQGVQDVNETLDIAFQAALLCDPLLVLPMPWVIQVDQVQVISITVPAGLSNVYSLEGRYLGREGAQSNPLSARRLRQLLLERGVVQFEAQIPPGATLDDLDLHKVMAYITALKSPGVESWQEILLRRGCLRREELKPEAGTRPTDLPLRPTYAALLLFGKYPQQWLPNGTILAAHFIGASPADQFIKQDIQGTLPEQLFQIEAFLRENMRQVVRLVGFKHEETSEYPLEAVREVLVNAVAHRDYNLQGDNIHLFIFSDRIEVHSPGGLPGPMTMQNLLQARFSRNAVIVQVLADLGYVERLGYGLKRVVEVMQKHHLRPPVFEDVTGSFRVTLFGGLPIRSEAVAQEWSTDYQNLEVNPRQHLAMQFLAQHRRITNRQYQELCPEVHAETLRRDLVDLVGRGLLIKMGDKRATYYVLKLR
ncbi:MAG: putative DNA binding domain-containing protein [Anaerolineales bacterium]|nr:putative DNA binding domain-containing protein [Anaerolineales bacterium]